MGERAAGWFRNCCWRSRSFYIGGQFANLDMLVAGCITVTITCSRNAALLSREGSATRALFVGVYAAAALGVLLANRAHRFCAARARCRSWLLLRRRWQTLLGLVSIPGTILFLLSSRRPGSSPTQAHFAGFLGFASSSSSTSSALLLADSTMSSPCGPYPAVLLLFTLPYCPDGPLRARAWVIRCAVMYAL